MPINNARDNGPLYIAPNYCVTSTPDEIFFAVRAAHARLHSVFVGAACGGDKDRILNCRQRQSSICE